MGKVKITQEQADAIEKLKDINKKELKEARSMYEEGVLVKWCRPVYELKDEEIYEALFESYEIKPKFKTGDIVNDGYGRIREVSSVGDNGIMFYTNHENSAAELFGNQTDEYKQIRHAKDEVVEIYKRKKFWNENGRKVWELKEGDVLNINDSYESIKEIYEGEYIFESGITEEVNNFNKLIEVGNVEVICFVHDRKDIKHD